MLRSNLFFQNGDAIINIGIAAAGMEAAEKAAAVASGGKVAAAGKKNESSIWSER